MIQRQHEKQKGDSVKLILIITAMLLTLFACGSQARADDIARQARHLLAQKCFLCHGPDRNSEDAQETDLRLDLREVALEYEALVAGDVAASEMMTRVTSQDPDSQMPPPDHGEPLSQAEVDVLRRWIQAGAVYETHWSFRKLQKTQIPQGTDRRSSGNPIDAFVLKRLGEKSIQPSQKADKRTLIRRVYADAIGMPPSPEEFQRFMDDPAPDAYQQLVDRVLENQHFGERWAQHWLDVARFAESGGFELDGMRPNAYQFRDFVIKAFNDDLPYNQFVQWQIAGDEFAPDNIEALKATGFLGCGVRNAVITKNQVEKERYDELDDILSATMTSMLGLSVGCARCHDHKYDPITSDDYYRLLSTFATTVRAEITVTQPSAEIDKALEVFERDHQKLVAKLADYEKESRNSQSYTNPAIKHQPLILSSWQSTGPLKTTGYVAGHNAVFPSEKTPGSKPALSATWRPRPELADGISHQISESNSVFFFHRTITAESATPTVLSFGADDTVKAWLDGELIAERIVASAVKPDQALAQITLTKGEHQLLVKIVNGDGIGGFYFNVKQQGVPETIRDIVTTPVTQRSPQQSETLLNWSRQFDAKWQQLSTETKNHLAQQPKHPQETVFVSTEGRTGFRPAIYNVQGPEFYEQTYILNRGDPNSKLELATQGFPKILMQHADKESHWIEQPPAQSKSSYRRKSLANWITDTQHGAGSLLARVIVNRLWQHHFGTGLVTTVNDFGTQGALPTHPELLEWLASELVRNDWSLKHIHRLILTSKTFQQGSAFSENASKVDPENKRLWRFTPRRLEAEAIRDSILAVSGKLERTMFGSGTLDPGQKRRSIYFTVKRSLLNPMLNLYDAPETLTSAGRRNSTTTAPQALLLINSPYIRTLAQAFAARVSPQYYEEIHAASELLAASIHGSPDVDIAVPNGSYTLQLLLYEGWRSRSADIVVEGKTLRAAYDMFKEQGGNFDHGSVLRHTFTLSDGHIDIEIKGPLHLGGLILSKGKAGSADRVKIVKSQADLDLKEVLKAINFGNTKDLNIGDVKFAAAAVNTTIDGVTNKAAGDVYAGQYSQKRPTILKEKTHQRLGDDLSAIVTKTYWLALNREPSSHELQAARQFIERQQKDYEQSASADAKTAALADFAQAVFSINEFIYVD
ncbi:PSD1 and planctomycete cytochrome C domain-containing protein [Pirellulaceae bacterium]|nr:PSD1 and planctomycete cytochrome C domain-containing protein [Pirellulaceae bacterium]